MDVVVALITWGLWFGGGMMIDIYTPHTWFMYQWGIYQENRSHSVYFKYEGFRVGNRGLAQRWGTGSHLQWDGFQQLTPRPLGSSHEPAQPESLREVPLKKPTWTRLPASCLHTYAGAVPLKNNDSLSLPWILSSESASLATSNLEPPWEGDAGKWPLPAFTQQWGGDSDAELSTDNPTELVSYRFF